MIAPLSANSLAKLSSGICDSLLTSLMRALDPNRTKVLVFPAMNTFMWDHPFTAKQLDILKEIGYEVIGPIGKQLACGDIGADYALLSCHRLTACFAGIGAMTEWQDIVKLVADRYGLRRQKSSPSTGGGPPTSPSKSFLQEAASAMADSNVADVSRFGLA